MHCYYDLTLVAFAKMLDAIIDHGEPIISQLHNLRFHFWTRSMLATGYFMNFNHQFLSLYRCVVSTVCQMSGFKSCH